ncbi:YqeG family HAD IIIA-type phosphatase [Levilactobacillus parabrevis]|uniref:YqeG family HAD IIIA-type phosphatase n=1 Tax=Levilactobacillus parabrevis TaxID=357278 RepID=UPI0021A8DE05|nr:YqeG family HAD IIIA-type phosphatase [Levilactobacillus parabrevis]MCT4487465.1 YqeG family HAD IIIA-type phosphatase [Levilactobacillus parabrevis]MCT4489749.1 YqeG family HAD IIIA-type phosphatase [Levilactobacillus parabrevis]
MVSAFKPTWMVTNIYDLTPDQLRAHGIKAVMTDLDNTLIAWNNPDGTPELRHWLTMLEMAGIQVIVVSNNSRARVDRAVAPFNLPYVHRALKPLTWGIRRALHRWNLRREEAIMVGDQLLTDVWSAHRSGVRSVLVKPILTSDAWITKGNRLLEKVVMWRLRHDYPELTWQEDLNERKTH